MSGIKASGGTFKKEVINRQQPRYVQSRMTACNVTQRFVSSWKCPSRCSCCWEDLEQILYPFALVPLPSPPMLRLLCTHTDTTQDRAAVLFFALLPYAGMVYLRSLFFFISFFFSVLVFFYLFFVLSFCSSLSMFCVRIARVSPTFLAGAISCAV